MRPLVSLIIPVYNTVKYLRKSIESAIKQTFNDIEIILVDDGSTDGSSDICDEYAKADSRIIVVHQKNAGVSVARNCGIEISRGEWIMFLDSDDWLESTAVETACGLIDDDYDWILLSFSQFEVQKSEKCSENFRRVVYPMQEYRDRFIAHCRIEDLAYFPVEMRVGLKLTSQCAKLYRAQLIRDNTIRFPVGIKVNEDGFFNICFIMHAREAVFFDSPIYHIVERSNSASRSLINISDGIVQSIHHFNKILAKYGITKSLSEYQTIDACLKAVFVVIAWSKISIEKKEVNKDCYNNCRQVISSAPFPEFLSKANLDSFRGIQDRLAVLMLKKKWYKLLFFITRTYYKQFKRR